EEGPGPGFGPGPGEDAGAFGGPGVPGPGEEGPGPGFGPGPGEDAGAFGGPGVPGPGEEGPGPGFGPGPGEDAGAFGGPGVPGPGEEGPGPGFGPGPGEDAGAFGGPGAPGPEGGGGFDPGGPGGGFDPAPVGGGGFDPGGPGGGFDPAPAGGGGFDPGPFSPTPAGGGGFDPGPFSPSPVGGGGFDPGPFTPGGGGGFDPGPFAPGGGGGFDPGPFAPGGGFEPIGFQPDPIFEPIFVGPIFEPIFVGPIFEPTPEEGPLIGAGDNLINSSPTLTPFSSLSLLPGGVDAISVFATDPNGDTISIAVTGGSVGTVSANINSGLDEIFSHGSERFAATFNQSGDVNAAFTAGTQAAQSRALELGITAQEFGPTNAIVQSAFFAEIGNGSTPINAFAVAAQAAQDFLPDMLFLAVANDFTNQSVTLDVTATDEHGATTIQTLFVSVGAAQAANNDAPVSVNDTLTVTEDSSGLGANIAGNIFTVNLLNNDADPDGDTLTITNFLSGNIEGQGDTAAVVGAGSATATSFGTITVSADGLVSYHLDNNLGTVNNLNDGQTLTENFNYTVTDSNGATDTGTLVITINGADENNAPVAANDTLIARENDPGSLFGTNVISNDTDIDADTFTITSFRTGSIEGAGSPITVSLPGGGSGFVPVTHGFISVLNTGGVVYLLDNTNTVVNDLTAGEILTETFNYTITDQHGLSDTATLNVNIVGAHDNGADPIVVGYYGLGLQSGNDNQAVSATASGTTTGLDLENVNAGDLAGVDILLAQNPSSNADLGGNEFENNPAIGNAINSGLVLIFHDQGTGNNETELTNTIPGLDNVTFTREVAEDINLSTQAKDSNLSTAIVSSGLAGNLNDNSLDGANNSRHGFVDLASLPNGAIPLLTTNNADEIVTFVYPQGQGHVIYSSIPINNHMGDRGADPSSE
ncbi:Ig-like domain-containing protein, partial [Alphaproteobacteria bacterium]|nr:Ig-like domain-containing protein [Alphaproteobacteria bacterium]